MDSVNTAPYERLRHVYGTWECAKWREAIFDKHQPIMRLLVNHYEALSKRHSYVAANNWLRETHPRLMLGKTRLWLHSDFDALVDYAEWRSKEWMKHIYQLTQDHGFQLMYRIMKDRVQRLGLTFPEKFDCPTKEQMSSSLARITDPLWLRRQLRVKQGRELETLFREMGIVCDRKGIYISDVSFKRRCDQKQRGQRLLESLVAENQLGDTYTLAELAELSTSNPINRRHELMTRIRGFEEFAQQSEDDWQAVLFTVTCPSKYHPVHSKSGEFNEKFAHFTPRRANDYLNTLWQRTRSAWDKQHLECFGFRVAEPHHDGTPHWHLLLFFRKEQIEPAEAIFKAYALLEDGDEKGAQEQRFQTIHIDPNKGTAAGYIAKYIAKNIDGFGVDTDHYGRDAVTSALRIEAWASLWGIRQFQQIGGPSVTVWRELRRLDVEHIEPTLLKELTQAADEGDWQTYTQLMGGAVCPRESRPVRPYMIIRDTLNKYSEQIQIIKGILHGPEIMVSRVHDWIIKAIDEPASNDECISANDDYFLSQAPSGAPPWTCVNNCTEGIA